ncbi:MAG: phage major capsid protein [Candidatus Woesearchaeota archaeon]
MEELLKRASEIIENAKKENRNLTEDEKVEFENIEKQIETLKAERRAKEMEKELRNIEIPTQKNDTSFRNIVEAMKEKRAITLNGTGNINVIQSIVSQAIEKNDLIKDYSYFYGENAQTNIPVFAPTPARPVGNAEDASSISADSTGVLGATSLSPKPFVSLLPVSYAAVAFNTNFENELKNVFAKVFSDAVWYQSLVGTGTNQFTGVFKASSTNTITCAATGAPAPKDLLALAIKAKSLLDNPVIVIHPDFAIELITGSSAKDPISNEFLINKTIFSVPVIVSSYALNTTTGGSIVAVAFDKTKYAVAIATELIVTPIRKPGDVNVYYQAELYMNGKPVIADDVIHLVAKSS